MFHVKHRKENVNSFTFLGVENEMVCEAAIEFEKHSKKNIIY